MSFLLRKGAHSPKEHYIRLGSHLHLDFIVSMCFIRGNKGNKFQRNCKTRLCFNNNWDFWHSSCRLIRMKFSRIAIFYLLLMSFSAKAQNTVCLNNQTSIPCNKYYAAGDFNNDNVVDFVMPAYVGYTFGINLSNGSQSYASPSFYTVAGTPLYLAAGDFNNDGNDDLAISCYDSNRVVLKYGNGVGSFTSSTNYGFVFPPGFIKSGDLNNDGLLDFAVSTSTNSFWVYKNNGIGGFNTIQYTYPAQTIDIEDYDNNGSKDLYITDYSGGAYFLQNLGNGTFNSPITTGLYLNCAFDLNNDGKKDLFSWNSYSLQVSLGTGNFNFSAPSIIASPYQYTGLVNEGDINGDGLLDISFYSMTLSSIYEVAVRLNNGSGGFLAPIIYTANPGIGLMEGIASMDVDGNGKADLVIYADNAPRLTMLYNCSVTDVKKIKGSNLLIKISPNPSNSIFKISSEIDIRSIAIQDINGKIILQSKQTNYIDLGNYSNGIYFLRVETVDGEIGNYKLIKTD